MPELTSVSWGQNAKVRQPKNIIESLRFFNFLLINFIRFALNSDRLPEMSWLLLEAFVPIHGLMGILQLIMDAKIGRKDLLILFDFTRICLLAVVRLLQIS